MYIDLHHFYNPSALIFIYQPDFISISNFTLLTQFVYPSNSNETTTYKNNTSIHRQFKMRLQLILSTLQSSTSFRCIQGFGTFTLATPANLITNGVHPLSPSKQRYICNVFKHFVIYNDQLMHIFNVSFQPSYLMTHSN